MRFHSLCILSLVALTGQITARAQKEPVVVERDRDYQVLRRVIDETQDDGTVRSRTSEVVQLGTGMHYLKDGEWLETKAEFQLFPGGAVAQQGPFQLIIAPDVSQEGLIDVLTPDGKRLRASPRWLAYYEPGTGKAEIIAAVKPCQGQLVSPNVVVFFDAFDDVLAAIRYTYQPWGIEQEIVLLDPDPLKPVEWGFNNPQGEVVLEMWSEFHEWPQPDKITNNAIDGRGDVMLDFGQAQLGSGKAFPLGDEDTSIPVFKAWSTVEQRQFLIEAVRQTDLEPLLVGIPKQAQRAKPGPGARNLAQRKPAQGRSGIIAQAKERERGRERRRESASIRPARDLLGQGISIDYSVVTSTTDLTLEAAKTYYVTNTVTLSGTTTIEGGTTVKFANITNGTAPKFTINGAINCLTDQYRPAVFTGKDDNTIGETISGSSGTPGTNRYAQRVFEFNSIAQSYDVHDVRIRYADKGFGQGGLSGVNYTVRNSQIGYVNYAFYNFQAATVMAARNVLVHDALTGIMMQTTATNSLEHVTFHGIKDLRSSSSGIVALTNSLLICVTNNLTFNGTNAVVTALDDTGIFATIGAGRHYLAASSPYRDSGITNINAKLAAERKRRTTYGPQILTNDFTADAVLYPLAQRDTDIPDLGYAYDPLDYLISNLTITNASVAASNGVAIGAFGANGLTLRSASKLISYGNPENMNRICAFYQVQEGPTNLGANLASVMKVGAESMATYPELVARFTDFSMGNGSPYFLQTDYAGLTRFSLRDCWVLGGALQFFPFGVPAIPIGFTNNLVQGCSWTFNQGSSGSTTPINLHFRNNLFYRGALTLTLTTPALASWYVHDNLFISNTLSGNGCTNSNSGYYAVANPFTPTLGSNKTLSSVSFQMGFLGPFYYPTNGAAGTLTDLVNAGSRSSPNAGLYHHTTATNQTKEASSTVDIGFHYIAANSFGLPVDSDGDGIPDWIEDVNGNGGVPDGGETDWQGYNSLFGLSGTPGLQVFTPLK